MMVTVPLSGVPSLTVVLTATSLLRLSVTELLTTTLVVEEFKYI